MLFRKIICFIPIWVTYYIGHFFSVLAYKFDTIVWIFRLYQWFMAISVMMEDWCDSEFVWTKVKEN